MISEFTSYYNANINYNFHIDCNCDVWYILTYRSIEVCRNWTQCTHSCRFEIVFSPPFKVIISAVS